MQATRTVYLVEMDDTYAEQLDQAPDDLPIVIMRDGVVVARLSPSFGPRLHTDEEVDVMMARWEKARENKTLGGITIRELIEEGRRY